MTADELASQPVQLDGPLQPFAVLLMQFGYAAAELHSPHTAAGWSNEKLLEWLAGHTSDRERYVQFVLNGDRNYEVFFVNIYCGTSKSELMLP